MASILISIIIDNVEEDADMDGLAKSITQVVADNCPYPEVTLNEWECQ